jgi:hypothetical protein
MSKRQLRRQSAAANLSKSPPVMIVRPHREEGWTCEETSQFVMKAFARGIADYMPLRSMTPDIARNKAITMFLHDPAYQGMSHIFFLDDDSPPWNDYVLEKLLSHKKPIVAGVTPIVRKRSEIDYSKAQYQEKEFLDCYWNTILMKDGKMQNIGIDELPKKPFVAHRMGGTCLMIERRVLEKLKEPYQKFEFKANQIDLNRSEDVYFCDQIRDAGFEILVDPDCYCHHYHRWDLLDVFSMTMQAKGFGIREKDQVLQRLRMLIQIHREALPPEFMENVRPLMKVG